MAVAVEKGCATPITSGRGFTTLDVTLGLGYVSRCCSQVLSVRPSSREDEASRGSSRKATACEKRADRSSPVPQLGLGWLAEECLTGWRAG